MAMQHQGLLSLHVVLDLYDILLWYHHQRAAPAEQCCIHTNMWQCSMMHCFDRHNITVIMGMIASSYQNHMRSLVPEYAQVSSVLPRVSQQELCTLMTDLSQQQLLQVANINLQHHCNAQCVQRWEDCEDCSESQIVVFPGVCA